MFLDNLHLENFKNYKSCSFSFSPGLNFIYGENGNGKTNILEAISYLCYTKSFLLNSEADCVKYSENSFSVSGDFENRIGTVNKLKVLFDKQSGIKQILVNNEKPGRLNSFIGKFPLVVQSPQDIKLTAGTPQDRRRNFDLLLSQVSRVYLDDLKNYNKVVKQKNSLLRDNLVFRKYSAKEINDLLEVWNIELVNLGIKIIIRRLDFLEAFKEYLLKSFTEIVGNSYIPIISYECGILENEDNTDIKILKYKFEEQLLSKAGMEIKRGMALIGPHRDNYLFRMNKNGELFDIKTFASQGEHKTFVVSLKLSEFEFIKENLKYSNTGEPILLLDDVFSELDKNRINKICKMITDYNQVFLTSTDKGYLDNLNRYIKEINSFRVINGDAALVN